MTTKRATAKKASNGRVIKTSSKHGTVSAKKIRYAVRTVSRKASR